MALVLVVEVVAVGEEQARSEEAVGGGAGVLAQGSGGGEEVLAV